LYIEKITRALSPKGIKIGTQRIWGNQEFAVKLWERILIHQQEVHFQKSTINYGDEDFVLWREVSQW